MGPRWYGWEMLHGFSQPNAFDTADSDSPKKKTWEFPKIGVPHKGWFIMENPIKMDDLGVPLFLETPTSKFSTFYSSRRLHH